MNLLIPLLLFFSTVVKNELNETCITSENGIGTCIPVKNCDFVLDILRSSNPTAEELYFLDHNTCGEIAGGQRPKPLVCCPLVPNVEGCGVAKIGNRIFGGDETNLGEIPWAGVIVYMISKSKTSVKCGCTLLNARWVLTAAHCIHNVPSSWKIHRLRFGEWNILKKNNCTVINDVEICRQEYEVEQKITHPSYQIDSSNMRHDIALFKTKENVQFTDYVIPICLPYSKEIKELPIYEQNFTVTGWGQTNEGNRVGVQRHVLVIGQNSSVCDASFAALGITLSDEQICVGGERNKDSCRGDSGGSLTREHGIVSYIIGIVSFGARDCGTEGRPGIYTNVIKYLDWIEEVISQHSGSINE